MLSLVYSLRTNFSLSHDADRSINIAHNKMFVLNFFECEATAMSKMSFNSFYLMLGTEFNFVKTF